MTPSTGELHPARLAAAASLLPILAASAAASGEAGELRAAAPRDGAGSVSGGGLLDIVRGGAACGCDAEVVGSGITGAADASVDAAGAYAVGDVCGSSLDAAGAYADGDASGGSLGGALMLSSNAASAAAAKMDAELKEGLRFPTASPTGDTGGSSMVTG